LAGRGDQAAVRNAPIFPSWPIDPVSSSAIATRIRTLPQAAVEVVLKLRVGKPATFRKSVVIVPVPLTWMVHRLRRDGSPPHEYGWKWLK
jgi:hypothetical protein